MKNLFNQISDKILSSAQTDEHLKIEFAGESTQFIRLNNSKIRQTGLVEDANLAITLIKNGKTCSGEFTLSENIDQDVQNALSELDRLRQEVIQLPIDPFIVYPENTSSTEEDHDGALLPKDQAVEALLPAMQGVDLAGIWASGRIFRGNANSAGQKHWFSTDSFSLDYSLITPEEKMVKATFAGHNWDQEKYEKFMANSRQKLEYMKRKPVKIKPGEYRTYIASAGVKDLLDMFSWNGISEASIRQGQSSFEKMKNEKVKLSPCFSLREDFRSGSVPRFNSEGEIAPEKLDLISSGMLSNTLISTRTAKEYGLSSNNAETGEYIRAPYMETGDLIEDKVYTEIDKGLYLGNLHYLNWSDNIGGRITGMTRYACFWVEDGEIAAPIENMRFDDSFYGFFGNNLEAVSKELHYNPEVGSYSSRSLGGTYCPGVLLSSFSLTL